jgi:hypothetical protein
MNTWGRRYVPALVLVGLGELDLDSVDAVYAVDEEDEDEDEGYLHPVLDFCH